MQQVVHSCKHHLGIAHLQSSPRFTDRMRCGGTSGARGDIRAPQLVEHREEAGRHVQDQHGDHERGQSAGSLFQQNLVLILDRLEATDAGAEEDAHFIQVGLCEIQS